jgi:hypothetical protein
LWGARFAKSTERGEPRPSSLGSARVRRSWPPPSHRRRAEAGRHQGARLLGQRDEALNVRDVVGIAVENGEGDGEQRQYGEHEQEPRCEPETERRLFREKRQFTISLSRRP